jgi:L-malate glycosyltransferase
MPCPPVNGRRNADVSMIRTIVGWAAWTCTALIYGLSLLAARLLDEPQASRDADRADGFRLLITGRFDSYNWCRAHLLPLASAACVGEIVAVTDGPSMAHDKIRYDCPPRWMVSILGRAVAKAIWMARIAPRLRPDVVMGYHIFPGAITALLVAKCVGARSVYQMVAGPIEVVGGGFEAENPLLGRLSGPSTRLERMALDLCRRFDCVVVRGQKARAFLLDRSAASRVDVIAGSIDPQRFAGGIRRRSYDMTFVGRLTPIKQPEQFVQIAARLAQERTDLRAAVVGNGPLLDDLRQTADALGVSDHVDFPGHVDRVEDILKDSKVFVLTSRSEGLSIGLAEAMSAGVVPVVADVGDLADLVHNGQTGWLVPPGDVETHATRIRDLLEDADLWQRLSDRAGARAIENNSLDAVTAKWEQCLSAVAQGC